MNEEKAYLKDGQLVNAMNKPWLHTTQCYVFNSTL